MSIRAKNISRMLENLGRKGSLSREILAIHFPTIIEMVIQGNAERVQVGNQSYGADVHLLTPVPAGTRIEAWGSGPLRMSMRLIYDRGEPRTVTAGSLSDYSYMSILVPLPVDPAGWQYPRSMGRVMDASTVGYIQ